MSKRTAPPRGREHDYRIGALMRSVQNIADRADREELRREAAIEEAVAFARVRLLNAAAMLAGGADLHATEVWLTEAPEDELRVLEIVAANMNAVSVEANSA